MAAQKPSGDSEGVAATAPDKPKAIRSVFMIPLWRVKLALRYFVIGPPSG